VTNLYEQLLTYDPRSAEYHIFVTLCLSVLVLLGLSLMFAALTLILRLHSNRREQMWQELHQLWNHDILDVLSGDTSVATFRKLVAPRQELNFIRFLAPYAYRLRGSDLQRLSLLALQYLPHVVKQLRHREAGVRLWAVNILSLFGMPQYETTMLEALQDEAPAVSMFAANTLLGLKRVQYVEPVMDNFHRFDKWNTNSLATLLSGIGQEAVPVLRQLYLDGGREVRTRVVAAEVLARFSDFGVADAAATLLHTETRQALVITTLRLLSKVGQEQHRSVVQPFCHSSNDAVRVNALRTLRHLCVQADRPLFIEALDDPNPWVARQAARALKLLGDTATLAGLVSAGHPRALLAREILAAKE
jgi:HEAT repeat protein